MIRILIVDDQKVIREKLRHMVQKATEMEVVGIATEGNSALEQVELLMPDVVLLDVEMPNMDGITTTRIIVNKFPQIKVLVLSSFDSQEYVTESLAAGAKGYLLKSLSTEELHNSIKFIYQGYSQLLAPGLARELVSATSSQVRTPPLTKSNSKAAAKNNSRFNGRENLESIENIGFDSEAQKIIPSQNNHDTHQLVPINPTKSKFSWKFWVFSWALLNITFWTVTLLNLKFKPATYISEWSLVLPGEEKVDVKIPDVGETLASNSDAVEDIDPRNNILYLASSKSVILQAAQLMGMSSTEFGEPTIELVDGSAVISFEIIGGSPQQAQAKANALHNSILETIKSFGIDKTKEKTESAGETLEADRAKLARLQNQFNQYTLNSDLVAPEQIPVLIDKIESLRDQKTSINRDLEGYSQEIASLTNTLGLSAEQAEDLLALQGDSIFQQHLQQYNQIAGDLAILESRFTANSPQVMDEKLKQQDIETTLLDRGRWIIDKPVDQQMLKQLSLKDNSGQKEIESMVKSLVSASSNQQILARKEQALEQQILELDARIKKLNQEKVPFENLQREIQFTEALLTSKTAKLNISGDSSPAFPDIQILSPPSLPDERNPNDLRKPLIGALALTFLSTTGLMLFAWDKKNALKI
jgi:DNA-binding NarL/FixJ family response regulator/uncharacterized protein involved in exopolysaccharide biosynthesis